VRAREKKTAVQKIALAHLRRQELEQRVRTLPRCSQKEATRYRHVVVEWMIAVCDDLNYSLEAELLSVRYYDRFVHFADEPIPREDLQLVAAAALLLASQFEDVYPIGARDLSWLTDDHFSAAEITAQELHMLRVLDGRLMLATEASFLCEALQNTTTNDPADVVLAVVRQARFFIEDFLEMVPTTHDSLPSDVARTAVDLARARIRREDKND